MFRSVALDLRLMALLTIRLLRLAQLSQEFSRFDSSCVPLRCVVLCPRAHSCNVRARSSKYVNEQGIYAKPVRFTKNRSDKKTLTDSGREGEPPPPPMSRARTISEPPNQNGPQLVRVHVHCWEDRAYFKCKVLFSEIICVD